MKQRNAMLMTGLLVLGAGALIALDRYSARQAAKAALEVSKECNVCTLRHQSYARSKKSRGKKSSASR